jgi:hypothetical protein
MMLRDQFFTILLVLLFLSSVLLAGIHLARVHGGRPASGPVRFPE